MERMQAEERARALRKSAQVNFSFFGLKAESNKLWAKDAKAASRVFDYVPVRNKNTTEKALACCEIENVTYW
jgi:hypothetical protein